MQFLKLFLFLCGLVAFYFSVTIAIMVLNLYVIGPRQHASNTIRAEAINAETWETGLAKIYTYEVRARIGGVAQVKSVDLVCARKAETSDITFKGGPDYRDGTVLFNPPDLRFPVSKDYELAVIDVPQCDQLARMLGKETPWGHGPRAVLVHSGQPDGLCSQGLDAGPVAFGSVRLDPPQVVSVRVLPVQKALDRDDFGTVDARASRERREPSEKGFGGLLRQVRSGKLYQRLNDQNCWGEGQRCDPVAERVCTPV